VQLRLQRRCTYAGRPFGDTSFVASFGQTLSTLLASLGVRNSHRHNGNPSILKARSGRETAKETERTGSFAVFATVADQAVPLERPDSQRSSASANRRRCAFAD
jgi:hypothetical protein